MRSIPSVAGGVWYGPGLECGGVRVSPCGGLEVDARRGRTFFEDHGSGVVRSRG